MGTYTEKVGAARVFIAADETAPKRLTNRGPGSVFYGGPDVTVDDPVGEIEADASLDVDQGYWFVGTGGSVLVEDRVAAAAVSQSELDAAVAAAVADSVQSSDVTDIAVITQVAYDLLDPPDPGTLYLVIG